MRELRSDGAFEAGCDDAIAVLFVELLKIAYNSGRMPQVLEVTVVSCLRKFSRLEVDFLKLFRFRVKCDHTRYQLKSA